MDTIEKWLKSLRLHKYTHLFKSLTYDEMLNLEEKYLIDREVTKGARNKMLISIKKLNLRQERLINMIEDLEQDNISMKEALTVLKDMLITPIPHPNHQRSTSVSLATGLLIRGSISPASLISSTSSASSSPTPSSSSCSSMASPPSQMAPISTPQPGSIQQQQQQQANNNNNYLDPYDLTYLFIETLEKVAQRLIESAGVEDNACHGIMAAIVDECLKHNSFTKEQKAKVASFKQHFTKEQTAKTASFKQQLRHQYQHHQQQQQQQQHQRQPQLNYNHHHYLQQQQQQQQQFHHNHNINNNHHYHYHYQQQQHHHNHWTNGPIQQPTSLSASLSTIGSLASTTTSTSASTSCDEEDRQTTTTTSYVKEYSLLGPGNTFELPCLRALAATEKHNRRQLCFLSNVFQ